MIYEAAKWAFDLLGTEDSMLDINAGHSPSLEITDCDDKGFGRSHCQYQRH